MGDFTCLDLEMRMAFEYNSHQKMNAHGILRKLHGLMGRMTGPLQNYEKNETVFWRLPIGGL
jgi:hypothetical protein